MSKLTIDGVTAVAPEEVEFILGGGSGVLKKFSTANLRVVRDPLDDMILFSKSLEGSTQLRCKPLTSSNNTVQVVVGDTSVDLSVDVPAFETPIVREPDTLNFWFNNALHMEHTGSQVFTGDVEFKGAVKGLPKSNGFIQCKEVTDIIKLVPVTGTSFVPSHSVCMMTLIEEFDGTPAVRYDVVSTGTVNMGVTTTTVKFLNVRVDGILSSSQYAFIDSIDIRGASLLATEPRFYDYRVDLDSRQTNNLKFYIGSEKGAITAKVQLKVSFVLPNENYGVGKPFPDAPTRTSKTHKVFSE